MKRVYILAATGAVLLQLGLSNIPTTAKASYKALCPSVSTGLVHCHAHVALDGSGHPFATAALSRGLSPSDLHDAYKLPAIPAGNFVWNGQTVAVVDAYDNPNAASDLFSYRKQFGLPVCAGANVNCLFSKLNQNGGSSLPAGSTSWGQEINLDIQMVSAICPQCKIILVEASSPTMANLSKAVDTAAALGVSAISNSYGGNEAASAASMQNHYNHPGIAITASSGDSGYGVEFPASSQYVTSVGGTSLQRSSGSRGWTE